MSTGFIFVLLISSAASSVATNSVVPKSLQTPFYWAPGTALETVRPLEKPFWRRKKKWRQRLASDRDILVSVKTEEDFFKKNAKPHRLFMQGAGHLKTSAEHSFKVARQFGRLKEVSTMILESKYDAKRRELFLHTKALGYHARMLMQVDVRPGEKELRWRNIRGVFTGMTGTMQFLPLEAGGSEISLTAEYQYKKFPIPRIFAEFGIEFALQKTAARMRRFIEKSPQKN